MNNTFKILIGILSLILLSLLGLWIYLKIEFSDEALTGKANEYLKNNINRQAGIEKVSLALWPPISMEIDKFSIQNPSDSLFLQERPSIDIPKIRLKLDLFKLFSGHIAVKEVYILNPYILQETALNGKTNFKNLMKADSAVKKSIPDTISAAETSGPLFAPDILIEQLMIENLTYEKLDRKENSALTLSESHILLSATLNPKNTLLTLDGEFDLGGVSFSNALGNLVENLRVKGSQKSRYWVDRDRLVFDQAVAEADGLNLSMEGEMDSLLTDEKKINLRLFSENADLKSVLSVLSKDLTKDISDAKTSGVFSFDLKLQGTLSDSLLPGYAMTFELREGSIQYPTLPKPITNLALSGKLENTFFELSRLKANLGSNNIDGALKLRNFENPYLNLTLKTNLNLGEIIQFYPLEKGTKLSGFLNADLKAAGLVAAPEKIKASGTAQFSGIGYVNPSMQTPLENLEGSLQLSNDRLEISDLSMTLGESDILFNGYATNYLNLVLEAPASKNTPYVFSSLRSNNLNLDELLPADTTQQETAQTSEGAVKREQLPDINAKFKLDISSLTINGMSMQNASGTTVLKDKILDLSGLRLNLFGGTARMNGQINLEDINQPRFNLSTSLSKLSVSKMFSQMPGLDKFAGLGKYLSAEVSLDSDMQGKLNDTLGLDLPTFLANGNFMMPFGRLSGMPVQKNIAKALNNKKFESVNFKNWDHAFKIKDGRVYVSDLKMSVEGTQVRADGSQGIDQTMDYKVSLKLPQSAASGLKKSIGAVGAGLITDKSGNVPVELLVKGTMKNPKIMLNKDALISNAAKNVLQPLKDQAKVKAQNKQQELKKDIQKKVDQEKKNLEKKTKKLLKNLFN